MSINTLATEVNRLSEVVRDHINTHRYQSALLGDWENWNQICSSLDIIGDSLYAVKSYEAEDFPEDVGLKYIYTYGVLQALFLMQDALRHLSEAFDITYEATEIISEIRNTRNASIGHPTKQNYKGKRYYNYISRISMAKSGFDLLRSVSDGEHRFIRVDLAKTCSDQLEGVIVSYRKIVEKLEEIDRMHKEKFTDSPLAGIFHSAMGYYFEKISEDIHSHSDGNREFGHRHVRLVNDTYEKFKTSLMERNEFTEIVEFDLNDYFHALERLDEHLSEDDSSIAEADARIYLSYLRHRHDHFVAIAEEIDEDYKTQT